MQTVIEERQIGEKLSVGVQAEGEEVGLFIASEDVSASCAFLPDEWEEFVEIINEAAKKI